MALGATIALLCAALAPAEGLAAGPLSIIGEQPAQNPIELSKKVDGSLEGRLVLLVTGNGGSTRLRVSYHPSSSTGSQPTVAFVGGAPTVKKGKITTVVLRFAVPAGGEPTALRGLVVLWPKGMAGEAAAPVKFNVSGAGSSLAGVALHPSTLTIHVTSWLGPFGAPSSEEVKVQLSGAGVPALFADGLAPPSFHLPLQAGGGHELHATLTELRQDKADPERATAEIEVAGGLTTGKYEGSAPISDLSSSAPALTVVVESGHSFLWPALMALLGAILGGALYLVSGRARGKALMRNRAKFLVSLYKGRDGKDGDGKPPMWSLDSFLGTDWYTIRWNPIPQIDGAFPTIWSNIHWARSEADLAAVSKEIDELSARVIRWTTTASSVEKLIAASRLAPKSIEAGEWDTTRAVADTAFLQELVQSEPATEEAATALVDRISRQAHWHTVLARAFNAKAVVNDAINKDIAKGIDKATAAAAQLKTADLKKLDGEASPESGRDIEKQAAVERDLASAMRTIRGIYEGADGDLELAEPVSAVYTVADRPAEVPLASEVTAAARADSSRGGAGGRPSLARLRGESAFTDEGKRIPASIRGVLRRDVPLTLLTAIISSVAYVPTVYGSTWGSLSDYATAFCAGFLGKVVVNWAALPAFQSIRSSVSSAPSTGAQADA
jgi:hypothetical protein